MMHKSRVIIAYLFVFILSCESTRQKLKSISDLRHLDFGKTVPKHSLLLLHWFANSININNNNVLYLSFDPNIEEFGSHHYGNFEDMLRPLPRGYRYYTVGNLYEEAAQELPEYVLRPPVREYEGNNMDRIIFRVQETNLRVHRVDQVYLTQHYPQHEDQGSRYNPEHTYQISINLLQQMRMFSVQDNPRSLRSLREEFNSNANIRDIRNMWGASLASLGLFLFIVIAEKQSQKTPVTNKPTATRKNPRPDFVVDIPDDECILPYADQSEKEHLDIITGKNGKATIVWSNVSRHRIKNGVAVVLFKHNLDQEASSTYNLIQTSEGRYDSSVLLNEGLQVRLHKAKTKCFFWTKIEEEICRGAEFKSPGKVSISGNNAYLQLFVRDGKACARLYIRKSFRQWKSEFAESWIGFYKSAEKDTNDYAFWKWQWVTEFQPGADTGDYYTLEYFSSMTVAPGVQARFILKNYKEIARTPTWP